jgi:inositol-pentakisphosphate 2-kinase
VLIPFSARHGIELSCVSHELVHWTQALQEQLVRALHLAERPKRWQASQLNRTVKGIFLMPLIASSSSMRALEWKPKWSAQSTDAPADADFCRTCAIRAQRNGEALQEPRFCPLALTSFDDQVRARALEGLIAERRWILSLSETAGLNQFFKKTDIFKSLRHLQQQAALENMELAMTLRDCSCYLLMQDGQVVECLLADLDPKSAEKRSHWQALERGLIDGGWYYESSQAGIKKCPGLGS